MNKTQLARFNRLIRNGVPHYVRIYDNGGKTADRYTAVFTGKGHTYEHASGFWHPVLGMSGAPFHPQGFCQHEEFDTVIDAPQGWPPAIGRKCHLGVRINFQDLPYDCRKAIMIDYCAKWNLDLHVALAAMVLTSH